MSWKSEVVSAAIEGWKDKTLTDDKRRLLVAERSVTADS
jgi:hypothetical protein